MKTENTDFIYRNDLDKACFQYDMARDKSKYLEKRNQSDQLLKDKAFEIVSNLKYDGYQRESALMFYKVFDKKSTGSGVPGTLANKSATEPNYELANELQRQIIRKFKRRKF